MLLQMNAKMLEVLIIFVLLIYVNFRQVRFKKLIISVNIECLPGYISVGAECFPMAVTGGHCIHPVQCLSGSVCIKSKCRGPCPKDEIFVEDTCFKYGRFIFKKNKKF